jgi:hypothetical protein
MTREIFHLPIEVYKDWVRDCEFVEWVQPQGIGEPLMYPWIVEALEYAKARGHKTMFYTNASLLTHDMSRAILEAGLDSLTFSIDGYNEKTFGTRAGLKWGPILANVLHFQDLRDRGGYETKTQVRGTITRLNKYRIPWYYWFWTGKVDVVTMMGEIPFPTPQVIDETPWTSGPGFRCYHIWPDERPLTPAITVLNNGDVVVCCQDWHCDYITGNLFHQTPLDAFNSHAYNLIRAGMETGIKYPILCEYCRLGKIKRENPANTYRYIAKVSNRVMKRLKPLMS